MNKNCTFRLETKNDYRAVEQLIREAFWNVYRPGCYEHYVMHRLRDDPAFVSGLDILMELDGQLIGQNCFMKTVINADSGSIIPVLTMGPICIAPRLKRRGFGKLLLDYSLERVEFHKVDDEGNASASCCLTIRLKGLHKWALAQCCLRAISPFTARAALTMLTALEYATTICQRTATSHSFCARS